MKPKYPTVTCLAERCALNLFDIGAQIAVSITRNICSLSSHNDNKILILAPFYLGDGISSTTILQAIRNHFKNNRITLVGPDSLISLWKSWNIADDFEALTIDEVYQLKRWKHIYKQIKRWRKQKFCKVFILDADPLVNLIGYMCGAINTVGFSYRGGGPFLTNTIGLEKLMYMSYERLQLLDIIGIRTDLKPFYLPKSDTKFSNSAKTFLQQKQSNNSHPIIALFPGTRKKIKQWPWEKYFSIIKSIKSKYSEAIFFLLGDKVNGLGEQQELEQYNLVPMWGKLDLPVLIELIRSLDLVIGGDTGPLHIAYGTKTPSITIFGPSDPERYFLPSNINHAIIPECECRPNVRRPKKKSCRTTQSASCLKQIDPQVVANKALKLLE